MRTCLEFSECPAPSSIKWKFTEMTKTERDLYGNATYVCIQQFYINSQIVFSTESERETVKRIQRTEDSRLETVDRGRLQHDVAINAILVCTGSWNWYGPLWALLMATWQLDKQLDQLPYPSRTMKYL